MKLRFSVRSEAATGGVLSEKVFLEISQNLQENTCARVSFLIKLQAQAKEISKNTLFTEHLRTTISVRSNSKKIVLEKYGLKILHLESVSKSCIFFTHVKSLFHHQRYFTNNSTDTEPFFFHDYFFLLFS